MRLSVPAFVLSLCAAFAVANPVPGAPGLDTSKVYIEQISYAGSGCKADSVAISPSQDWTIVTLAFDNFIASIGPGIPFTEKRKNCNVNFKVHYPQGYSFTLFKTDYYGRVDLQDKVVGIRQSRYWFAGFGAGISPPPCKWVGKKAESYHCTDTYATEALVWSPCGASTTLNVNAEVSLNNDNNPKGSGLLTVDVIDQKVKTIYSVQWKKC
jgi:hypothetical protein